MPKLTITLIEEHPDKIDDEIFSICFNNTILKSEAVKIQRIELRDYHCIYDIVQNMEENFAMRHNGKRRLHFPIELSEIDYKFFKDSVCIDKNDYTEEEISRVNINSQKEYLFVQLNKQIEDIKKKPNYFYWLFSE
jgi:hypothetical protein